MATNWRAGCGSAASKVGGLGEIWLGEAEVHGREPATRWLAARVRPEREQQRDGVVDMSPDSGLQTSFLLVLEYKITM
jgi:hypothetical protein